MTRRAEWVTIGEAAQLARVTERTVYAWLEKPEDATGIRRLTINRTQFLNARTVLDYEATIKIGRPRKDPTK